MDNSKPDELPKPKSSKHFHVGVLVLVIILILILFKLNLRKVVESPVFQSNVNYIEEKSHTLFNQYLAKPAIYIWNNLFSDWIKQSIEQIRHGGAFKVEAPEINQDNFDKVIQPDKINKYFGNTSEETVNKWTSPTGN